MNWMSNAVFKYLLGMNETEAGADFLISTSIMPLPTPVTNITIDITTLIGGLLYPFAASFLIPVSLSLPFFPSPPLPPSPSLPVLLVYV